MQAAITSRLRRWRRSLLLLVVVAAALWLQRPHVAELPHAVRALGRADGAWILVALTGSVTTYVMAAFAMVGTVHERLPFTRVLQAQVASGATTLAAPAGLGAAGLNVWFLERFGVERREAFAAAIRNGVAGGVVHVIGLIAVVAWLPELVSVDTSAVRSMTGRLLAAAGLVVIVLLGVARWQRERTRRMLRAGRRSWAATVSLLARRDRVLPLLGGSVGLTLANGVTFWAAAHAVGVPLDLPTAIAVELVVEALGAVSATPGGVGVVEVATLEALLLLGVAPASALAAVFLHRSLTFWLPALPGLLALRRLQEVLPTDAAAPALVDDTGVEDRVLAAA